MYIQTTKEHLQRLKNEHTDGEVVDFASNGTAQVSESTGKQLIDAYEHITEK